MRLLNSRPAIRLSADVYADQVTPSREELAKDWARAACSDFMIVQLHNGPKARRSAAEQQLIGIGGLVGSEIAV